MRQLNGNLLNKSLMDSSLSKLIGNGDQKKLDGSQKGDKEPALIRRPNQQPNQMNQLNQLHKPAITNENRIPNDNKLDQLLIKMEKSSENQSTQSIVANLASQSQLALSQIQQQLLHQQQFGLQQSLINQQTGLPAPCGELSIEQLNQLYYYYPYLPFYYMYKLNENSGKTAV